MAEPSRDVDERHDDGLWAPSFSAVRLSDTAPNTIITQQPTPPIYIKFKQSTNQQPAGRDRIVNVSYIFLIMRLSNALLLLTLPSVRTSHEQLLAWLGLDFVMTDLSDKMTMAAFGQKKNSDRNGMPESSMI
jgi:hypothetical protein